MDLQDIAATLSEVLKRKPDTKNDHRKKWKNGKQGTGCFSERPSHAKHASVIEKIEPKGQRPNHAEATKRGWRQSSGTAKIS